MKGERRHTSTKNSDYQESELQTEPAAGVKLKFVIKTDSFDSDVSADIHKKQMKSDSGYMMRGSSNRESSFLHSFFSHREKSKLSDSRRD